MGKRGAGPAWGLCVHMSVILLLVGGLVGSFFGFEGLSIFPRVKPRIPFAFAIPVRFIVSIFRSAAMTSILTLYENRGAQGIPFFPVHPRRRQGGETERHHRQRSPCATGESIYFSPVTASCRLKRWPAGHAGIRTRGDPIPLILPAGVGDELHPDGQGGGARGDPRGAGQVCGHGLRGGSQFRGMDVGAALKGLLTPPDR
jgi:hypothetical protein